MQTFLGIYSEELKRAREERPDEYAWPVDELPRVLKRMTDALIRGTYNKDSIAIRRTCKRLGIKHTYQAINASIAEGHRYHDPETIERAAELARGSE